MASQTCISAESSGKAHRMGSCGQGESAWGGEVYRWETSPTQRMRREMSLLVVAGLGVLLATVV